MSKFLVIGASSFTGKNFCDYLESKGEEVSRFSLRNWWGGLPESDYVVNFAAMNVVAPSWEMSHEYLEFNVLTQNNLFQRLLNYRKIKKYVHISTPEVYGSTTGTAEDQPFNPSTPYAVSRAAAEWMLRCYFRQYGFPVVTTRASNIYGPGQQLYRLIPKLICCIKKGVRFPLEGGGKSRRAFVHVKDVCDGIYRVAMEGETGQAYNMSSPVSWSILGVVEIICAQMGVKVQDAVEIAPERPGKDQDYRLNDTKIRRLGWNDWIPITTGIQETIAWIEKDWEQLKDQSLNYEP